MKKRLLVIALLAIMLLTMCMAMFGGCVDEDPEPREVELELINPTTGEVIKRHDTIDLPEEGTPIYVRVKDKETGDILTDDDIPYISVRESYHVGFIILDNDGHSYRREGYTNWPTKEDIESVPYYNYYEMAIFFDCRPENWQEAFKPKYKSCVSYVRFYINKPWRDGDDRYSK